MSYITIHEVNDLDTAVETIYYNVDLGEVGDYDIEIDPEDYVTVSLDSADVDLGHIAKRVEDEGELDSLIAELAIVFGVEKLLEALANEAEKLRINTLLEPAA